MSGRRRREWNDVPYWETRKSLMGLLPQDEIGHEFKRKTGTYVYFLHAVDRGRIKIGYTAELARRLRDFQTGFGALAELKLIGSIDGDRRAEVTLHDRFAEHRVSGEWFNDCILDECREFIALDALYWGYGQSEAA